jgi:hypothetical protein
MSTNQTAVPEATHQATTAALEELQALWNRATWERMACEANVLKGTANLEDWLQAVRNEDLASNAYLFCAAVTR